MTTAPGQMLTVEALAEGFRGGLVRPGDPSYDEQRAIFNAMYDKRPALVARCSGVADVIAAVDYARDQGSEIAVRCGGHSVHGYSAVEGGIVIDVRPMSGIWVDPEARTARAQAGLNWGGFDRETQAFGLATTGGRISTTGITGQTLGSGSGWLERQFGLSCDNLISVDLVTADGELVTASERQNPELFWGLRGAGHNFGVVTSLEFRLHPVGPIVLGGMLLFPVEAAPELLRVYRDLMREAPDEFGGLFGILTAPPEEFVPEAFRGQRAVGVVVCHTGDIDQGQELLAPFRERGPQVDLVQPMPYCAVQQLLDAGSPYGQRQYWRTETVHELTDAAIDAAVEQGSQVPQPFSLMTLEPGGRAIARVGEDDTPISHRDAEFRYYAIGVWDEPVEDELVIGWARDFSAAMDPHASEGIQLNFPSDISQARIRRTFGEEKYARLVALKDQYDPNNLFHLNGNIEPSG
jgi:FAD binding domain-containing protein/berberine-like enzyme